MQDKTILIVDDETAIRDMVSIALELAGFNCLKAENAQQAHALIIDESPDLVLLDWMMPGTSGIELLRRLRRDGYIPARYLLAGWCVCLWIWIFLTGPMTSILTLKGTCICIACLPLPAGLSSVI